MAAPSLDRRAFLTRSALVVAGAGAALAGCTDDRPAGGDQSAPGSPTPTGGEDGAVAAPATPDADTADLSSWEGVRAQFTLDPDLAHFAAFTLAPHPAGVRASIEQWREALNADPATVVNDDRERDEAVRQAAGAYLDVPPEAVALTDSTTAGLGLVYHGLRLQPDDHVLTTTHEFYATHEALRLAAERSGAEVEAVDLYEDPAEASAGTIVDRLADAVRPSTRVVALTWVHSGTGVKLPVRDIADALEEINAGREPAERALLCLDAVHGLGAEDPGPAELGCDVYIAGTHKWLFGPRGTGLVWAREPAGAAIAPIIPPFHAPNFTNWRTGANDPSPFGVGATPGGYKPYEHRWATTEAFEFHLDVGRERIADRTHELATRLKEGLADLPGVRLVTPPDPALSSGLVCCAVAGDPGEVLARLRDDHGIVAGYTPYRESYLRFGTSIVTSPEEVDRAVEAVADLA